MAAVSLSGMLAAEAAALAAGWTEEQLLDLAGERLGRAIGRFFPVPGTLVAYLGKGHNAGDAMVALLDQVKAGNPGAGVAAAVTQMGIVLAEHFPRGSENPNELPDRLIQL